MLKFKKAAVAAKSAEDLAALGIVTKPFTVNRNDATGKTNVPGMIIYTPLMSFFAPIYSNEQGSWVPMPGIQNTNGDGYIRYVQFTQEVYQAILEVAKQESPVCGEYTPWYLQDFSEFNTLEDFGITGIEFINGITQGQIDAGVAGKIIINTKLGKISGVTIFESNDHKELSIRFPNGVRVNPKAEQVLLKYLHVDMEYDFEAVATPTRVKRQVPAAVGAGVEGRAPAQDGDLPF